MLRALLPILGLVGLAVSASAQMIPPQFRPAPPAAPILHVRVLGPKGTDAIFYPNSTRQQGYALPVSVGLRPGYTYRFKLAGISGDPKDAIYPTLEVIGTLHMPCWIGSDKHPVPVAFRPDEIERALKGSFFTKVYLIEHPDRAVPISTRIDDPLETIVEPQTDLLAEARAQGRPLLIVRFGHRQFSDQELHAQAVGGTMLLPDDKILPMADRPPHVPYACYPFIDPINGARYPEEECMHDGGDTVPPAGFDPTGNLAGLDPSDTMAEYKDSKGDKRLAISNRVCICVPRFLVIKTEVISEGYDLVVVPRNVLQGEKPPLLQQRIPSLLTQQVEQPEVARNRQQPSVVAEAKGPVILDQLISTGLVIGQIGSKVVIGVAKKEIPSIPAPLVLCKRHDTPCGKIGDVVTFHLDYTNPGGTPITDVVVSDSLTGRLEYVAGSQKSDRDAVFSTQDNEAGSLILRWQIKGVLQPGQSGTVSFQAKIR